MIIHIHRPLSGPDQLQVIAIHISKPLCVSIKGNNFHHFAPNYSVYLSKCSYFEVKCFENRGADSQDCLSFLADILGTWALLECPPQPHHQPQPPSSLPPPLSPWELLACLTVSADGSNTQGHLIVGKEQPSACQGQMQTHKAVSSKTSHQREPCLGLPRAELPLSLSFQPCWYS